MQASDKAAILERLAGRADASEAERAVLLEAAARFREQGRRAVRGEGGRGAGTEPRVRGGAGARAILWTDGAARGNPGPAGIGAVLETAEGRRLAEHSEYIGTATNNVAEYRALVAGLERAREAGVRELEVRADSELMIRQLNGAYRVKNAALRPLYERARELLAGFAAWQARHVPRGQNTEADRLANLGIDERDER